MPLSCPGENALSIKCSFRCLPYRSSHYRRTGSGRRYRRRYSGSARHRRAPGTAGVGLLGYSLLDCSGIDGAVVVDRVDTALSGAAAICQLGLHLVKAILDSRTELAGLFKRLIAETAGRIVVLTRDRGLLVTESPNCILEAVEVHGVAQACFSNWLTCGATVAEAKAVAAYLNIFWTISKSIPFSRAICSGLLPLF